MQSLRIDLLNRIPTSSRVLVPKAVMLPDFPAENRQAKEEVKLIDSFE